MLVAEAGEIIKVTNDCKIISLKRKRREERIVKRSGWGSNEVSLG